MRRRYSFVCLFLCLVLCLGAFGCRRKKQETEKALLEENLVYPVTGVTAYCLDEEGNAYVFSKAEAQLIMFDVEGKRGRQWAVPDVVFQTMCFGNGFIYTYVVPTEEADSFWKKPYLIEFSLENGEVRELYRNEWCMGASRMLWQDDTLFFLEYDGNPYREQPEVSNPQYNRGGRLWSMSPATLEKKELPAGLLCSFSKYGTDEFMILAYDPEGEGYFFAPYNIKTNSFAEKCYVSYGFDNMMRYFDYEETVHKLLYASIFKNEIVAVAPAAVSHSSSLMKTEGGLELENQFCCQDGRGYFLEDGTLTRFRIRRYLKETETLRILTDCAGYDMIPGSGYEFEIARPDMQSMTTSILAADPEYDFWLLSTDSPLAENIRRMGAYAPLNNVEGIEEYLRSSFVCMEEAATAENGAIWMLPCELDVEVFLYQPELLWEYAGIRGETVTNRDLFVLSLKHEEEKKKQTGLIAECNFLGEWKRIFSLYLADYVVKNGKADFHQPIFQEYAQDFLKAGQVLAHERQGNDGIAPGAHISTFQKSEEEIEEEYRTYYQRCVAGVLDRQKLFQLNGVKEGGEPYNILLYDFFEVCAMPSLDKTQPKSSIAHAYMLVLNPNSKHREDAERFLSTYANMLMEEESILRSRTLSGTYSELQKKVHAIYADSRIVFAYPEDVFQKDFLLYLNGNKSLQEIIPELERKLNMYLKE